MPCDYHRPGRPSSVLTTAPEPARLTRWASNSIVVSRIFTYIAGCVEIIACKDSRERDRAVDASPASNPTKRSCQVKQAISPKDAPGST
jgi:hypothetical protein